MVWVLCAVVLFAIAPDPPHADPVDADAEAVWRRTVEQNQARARRWQSERGDLTIPWDEAEGHLAIVVDDVGRELRLHEQLQALRFRLTFSVLPGSVYAAGAQLRLRQDARRPREILLHLPLEPLDAARMSEGPEAREEFLLSTDSGAELRAKLERALAAVPAAVGVNNHMGSRLTADRRALDALWPVLAERGLFFMDSRTTAETVAAQSAAVAGIPALSRHVFLDHDPSRPAVAAALASAASRARSEPTVVICHPMASVVDVLREQLPQLHGQGIGIYPVSEVLMRVQRGDSGPGGRP